jgi:hypothetical protein
MDEKLISFTLQSINQIQLFFFHGQELDPANAIALHAQKPIVPDLSPYVSNLPTNLYARCG